MCIVTFECSISNWSCAASQHVSNLKTEWICGTNIFTNQFYFNNYDIIIANWM